MKNGVSGRKLFALGLAASAAAMLAACDEDIPGGPGRSLRPIPSDTIALMEQKGTTPSAPVLIRTYKKEAEFEIWKLGSDGRYVYLKSYPMCRWSGQLGPKTREGDMQVPEGFYPIAPGQMNPNSNYYLSFNVGYPNAYDRAYGRTGGSIMVHGACSSAGCFSMTDAQIAEIYAIAREAFNGGQREIQMQSYPFHMTVENLAKHRFDPNIDFWKQLKTGADHFEVTKTEPEVDVCGKRYIFDAKAADGRALDPSASCPALQRNEEVEQAVAAKQAQDDAEVAQLIKQGVKPIELVYQDGGQNPQFRDRKIPDVSDPEALVSSPTEVLVDERGKPVPAVVTVAAADAARAAATDARAYAPVKPAAPATAVAAWAPAAAPATQSEPSNSPFSKVLGVADSSGSMVKKWLGFGGADAANAAGDLKVFVPTEPIPTDVPLPPRRDAAMSLAPKPQASAAPWVARASALTLAAAQPSE